MNAKKLEEILLEYGYDNIDIELWKDVPIDHLRYRYQISNYGRLRNCDTGKLVKPYYTFDKFHNKSRSRFSLHVTNSDIPLKVTRYRLVALVFVENDDPYNNTEVDHLDGDKTNDHFSNLEWVTPEENKRRAMEMGLRPKIIRGERNSISKWKNNEVEFICELVFHRNIRTVDELYSYYIKKFNENLKDKNQLKNLYYNLVNKKNPKWLQISSKYSEEMRKKLED